MTTMHATTAAIEDIKQRLGTHREGVPLSNEIYCQAVEAVEHYFSAEYVHPDPEVSTCLFRGHYVSPLCCQAQDGVTSRLR